MKAKGSHAKTSQEESMIPMDMYSWKITCPA